MPVGTCLTLFFIWSLVPLTMIVMITMRMKVSMMLMMMMLMMVLNTKGPWYDQPLLCCMTTTVEISFILDIIETHPHRKASMRLWSHQRIFLSRSCSKQTNKQKWACKSQEGPLAWHTLASLVLLKRRGYNCKAGRPNLKFTMDNHSGRRDRKGLTGCLRPVATNPVMLCQIIQGAAVKQCYGPFNAPKPKCTGEYVSKTSTPILDRFIQHCCNLGGLDPLHFYPAERIYWIQLWIRHVYCLCQCLCLCLCVYHCHSAYLVECLSWIELAAAVGDQMKRCKNRFPCPTVQCPAQPSALSSSGL